MYEAWLDFDVLVQDEWGKFKLKKGQLGQDVDEYDDIPDVPSLHQLAEHLKKIQNRLRENGYEFKLYKDDPIWLPLNHVSVITKQLRQFSKNLPEDIFVITAIGQEQGDYTRVYIRNGKAQETSADIVFDDFDENLLREEKP